MIHYSLPDHWIMYDMSSIQTELVEAKSSINTLKMIPYQREWVDDLQHMELKREVAGTSRIEGADFTETELDEALKETPEELFTRSQRQAHAAVKTYRWITTIPDDLPLNSDLVKDIHRRMVTNADDDHCPPGIIRKQDENVTFGQPRHRGASGGEECEEAFEKYSYALQNEFSDHDLIVQAIAAHYHFAAMHPFLDGNGRTARALEALILQRAGLRDTCFIAMSNYYYDEKNAYLKALADARSLHHNITPFLSFALKGIALQSKRLLKEIKIKLQKEVYRNLMYDLFTRLKTPKKRLIAKRQINILRILLDSDSLPLDKIYQQVAIHYSKLKSPDKAFVRDLQGLLSLQAIKVEQRSNTDFILSPNLKWPTEITESDFQKRIQNLPKAKTYSFLRYH